MAPRDVDTPDGSRRHDRHDGRHEGRHDAAVEEWVFAAWTPDAALGVISGHRIVGPTAWYWAALARAGRPLLHITDFDVPVRADPFILKGEAMWAEHFCDAPMEQWSIGNETYASALDDPEDALGLAYGVPTPIAFDLEWYAIAEPVALDPRPCANEPTATIEDGYDQVGVVHGSIEVLGEPTTELVEVPARRWHRWVSPPDDPSEPSSPHLDPITLTEVAAHTGIRAPFSFPDGTRIDPVLTAQGWMGRRHR